MLRILGTNRDGQIVRIGANKCTIGSGPHCTVRLRAGGIYPLHCLILRGAEKTVVRRWAPDTLLNGRTFTDSELRPGDRLSIGRIELEVLPGDEQSVVDPAPVEGGTQGEAVGDHALAERLAAVEHRLAMANRDSRQRVRALVHELRSARARIQVPPHETPAPEATAEHAELAAQEQRLQQQRDELENRQRDLDRQDERLQSSRAELDARRHELDEQQGRWLEEKAAYEERCQEQLTELDTVRQQLQADVEQQQHKSQENCTRREAELEQLNQELDRERDKLESEREAIRQERQEWERWQAEQADEHREEATGLAPEQESRKEEPQSPRTTLDSMEVFRRLGTMPDLHDDPEPEQAAKPFAEPVIPVRQESAPRDTGGESSGGDDESIEQYMQRLLQRVRGESEQPKPAAAPERRPVTEAEPKEEIAPEATVPESPVNTQPSSPEELAPRAVAPEKLANMSAMRELANLSANAAIERHTRRRLIRATQTKLMIAASGVLAGGLTFWVWWSGSAKDVVFYGALISFVIAAAFGIQYVVMSGRLAMGRWGRFLRSGNRAKADRREERSEDARPALTGRPEGTWETNDPGAHTEP